MTPPLVEARSVSLDLQSGTGSLRVLDDVSIAIHPGEVVAVVGPSGSGKTSLLMVLAGLQRPTAGTVLVDNQDISALPEDKLAILRRHTIGILFQSFHLIPSLTACENVALALEIAEVPLSRASVRSAAENALREVGLGDRLDHLPTALSGGEQQRVGLARALVTRPRVLLADEPTGNLDQQSGARVIDMMFELSRTQGTAVLLITHDRTLAARADRIVSMDHGRLASRAPMAAQ